MKWPLSFWVKIYTLKIIWEYFWTFMHKCQAVYFKLIYCRHRCEVIWLSYAVIFCYDREKTDCNKTKTTTTTTTTTAYLISCFQGLAFLSLITYLSCSSLFLSFLSYFPSSFSHSAPLHPQLFLPHLFPSSHLTILLFIFLFRFCSSLSYWLFVI